MPPSFNSETCAALKPSTVDQEAAWIITVPLHHLGDGKEHSAAKTTPYCQSPRRVGHDDPNSPVSNSGSRGFLGVSTPAAPSSWRLTPAEARIVACLASGAGSKEIALLHNVSIHTVRTHLKRAMSKAGVHTQAALIAKLFTLRSVAPRI